jgi:hypothetical protein|tara:strand:- start:625 stop:921 length:297 start_codon:yes stop_codon:yes gene_type:complete
MTKQNFDPKELKNSNRIFKSATPKYTIDWYIKWVASVFVLTAMAVRGQDSMIIWDVSLSFIGVSLWLVVSILWNDRALILLNGIGIVFLLRTLVDIWT